MIEFKDYFFMEQAKIAHLLSNCIRRQYGAVLVLNDKVIASTANRVSDANSPCLKGICARATHKHNDGDYATCPAIHAEAAAIAKAKEKNVDLSKCKLYLYGAENGIQFEAVPCPVCQRLIDSVGIKEVVGNVKV